MDRSDPYPKVYLGVAEGGRGVSMRAHRLVCMLAHGLPAAPWKKVDCIHLCDCKRCVNPLHLAWASRSVNASANANNQYEAVWRARGGEAYYVGSGSVDQLAARLRQRLRDDEPDGSRGGGDGGAAAADVGVRYDAA